jgi:hypothetical protein
MHFHIIDLTVSAPPYILPYRFDAPGTVTSSSRASIVQEEAEEAKTMLADRSQRRQF